MKVISLKHLLQHLISRMDSPLLPRLRGNAQTIDETFGDISLAADSPAPPVRPPPHQQQISRGPGLSSLLNRPPPTRRVEETPEAPQRLFGTGSETSRHAAATSNINTKGPVKQPRFSLFAPSSSQSERTKPNSQSSGLARRQALTEEDEEEHIDEEAEEGEGGEGDRTITIEQEEETATGRAAREERLKDSLYELRSINDTFEIFLGALESARGHNEVFQLRSVRGPELIYSV
jgi:hypothetical protein